MSAWVTFLPPADIPTEDASFIKPVTLRVPGVPDIGDAVMWSVVARTGEGRAIILYVTSRTWMIQQALGVSSDVRVEVGLSRQVPR